MPILSYFPSGGGGDVTVTVATPSQKEPLTYTGEILTPEWSGYDPEKLTLDGVTSATESGSYAAVFTPKVGYCWEDLTVAPRTVSWTVDKAAGKATASVLSISLDTLSSKTATFTVARLGDGAITVKSSKTSVASVSVSGSTVTVTSKAAGTAVITVSVAEGSNHTAAADITVDVTVACLWKKYATVTSTQYNLTVPSLDCSLDELQSRIDEEEEDGDYSRENSDIDADYGAYGCSPYSSVSINDSGEIVGGTASSWENAQYVKSISPAAWYYVGYNNEEKERVYLFEITAVAETVKARGSFVANVTSTNSSAYPDDGVHTDGYWYVKQ